MHCASCNHITCSDIGEFFNCEECNELIFLCLGDITCDCSYRMKCENCLSNKSNAQNEGISVGKNLKT